MGSTQGAVTRAEARQAVRAYLDGLESDCRRTEALQNDLSRTERALVGLQVSDGCDLAIVEDLTIEGDFGWVFFWQSRKYLEPADLGDALVGNAPLLVSRADGSLHETGTALPIEAYIENFKRCSNPQG